jgi:hypothetical protein
LLNLNLTPVSLPCFDFGRESVALASLNPGLCSHLGLVSHLVSAAGDLDFGLQLALWQIPKALKACASSLKVAGLQSRYGFLMFHWNP